LAATYKTRFKKSFYNLNKKAIQAGKKDRPFAYIIPQKQHDPSSVVEMLKRLQIANVQFYKADTSFQTKQGNFEKGDFIIPLAQSARAYIKDLMEVQEYPNLRAYPGGPPRKPYDVTAWTLPLQFGVEAHEIREPFTVEKTWIRNPKLDYAEATIHQSWLVVPRRYNDSFKFVNSVLKRNLRVYQKLVSDSLGQTAFVKFAIQTHLFRGNRIFLRGFGNRDFRCRLCFFFFFLPKKLTKKAHLTFSTVT